MAGVRLTALFALVAVFIAPAAALADQSRRPPNTTHQFMPPLIGLRGVDAMETLKNSGICMSKLVYLVGKEPPVLSVMDYLAHRVVSQSPNAGTSLRAGQGVTFTVAATGPRGWGKIDRFPVAKGCRWLIQGIGGNVYEVR
jgi:hypothetical protein